MPNFAKRKIEIIDAKGKKSFFVRNYYSK